MNSPKEIRIYTFPGCYDCREAKKLFELNGIDIHEEIVVGKDITREELLQKHPDYEFCPYVTIADSPITLEVEKLVIYLLRKNIGEL